MSAIKKRGLVGVAALSAVALLASGCAASQRDEGSAAASSDATFTFAAAGAPKMFDPFYASDGETFRVTNTIYEGLLTFKPGTVELAPSLATDWSSTEDGLEWTFTLREGVNFHDGTEFNADAVCFNFERWYNQTGDAQNAGVSYSWINDFGGFADSDTPSVYESCEAPDDTTAIITLTRATSHFPVNMAYSSFAMASPAALVEYDADNVVAQGEGFTYPEYATSHPTGTGAFKFVEYDSANGVVTVERFDDYWGEPAGVEEIIFRIIPGETERRQELEAGRIDGYDLPSPVDWNALADAGNQILIRDAFNVMYVGLNATTAPELLDLRVRQALLHAINREQLVETQLPENAYVASQFLPRIITGYNPDLEPYAYDPELARELLAEAGQSDLTIELWYPTEVTRPYMPAPQRVFEAVRADWEAVGINVVPVSKPWSGGYIDGVYGNQAPAYLLGGTGHYNAADTLLGPYFGTTNTTFATGLHPFGDELAALVHAADEEADPEVREELYKELNRKIMEDYLPALPISHSPPAIVVAGYVDGLVPNPVTKEDFSKVTVSK